MRSYFQLFILGFSIFLSLESFAQPINFKVDEKPTLIELVSSDINTSIIQFKVQNFKKRAVTTPKGLAFIIETDKGTPMQLAGAPDLEKLSTSVIIPNLAEMQVDIISSDFTDYNDIEIAPSKGNLTRDKNPKDIPFNYGNVYQKNEFFPSNTVSLQTPHVIRNVRGQTVSVSPFQYNPITKTLRVYNEITLKISIKNPENGINPLQQTNGKLSSNQEFNNIYSTHFLNSAKQNKSQLVEEKGNMLIICHEAFMSSMEPFLQWKKQKGIPTEMVSISSIGNNETSIKNYVANYYNTKGLTYLLLVGDAAQITPMFFASSGHSDNGYAYVAGNDAYPEFFVGRFSAENNSHVTTQVNRIIQYEKYPDLNGTWYKKGIAIGSNEGPGDDNEYDYQHQRNIRAELLNYNYSNIAELYDGSQGGEDANGDPNPSNVTSLVESGVGIINYTGHGGNESFVTTNFSNSNVDALNNNVMWPFIWSVACVNGEFVDYTCFAEHWLRATDNSGNPTGAVSVLMSTINQSWNPPMEAQDEFNAILTESYANNIKRTFGGISMSGCMKMNDSYGKDGEAMTDTWTLFGDPSVMLRTNTPVALNVNHEPTLFIGSSFLQVNCDQENATVCLTVNGEIIGVGEISGGLANINFDELATMDTIVVTVTGYNAVPYISNVLVVAASGPYVFTSSKTINDLNGNNNGEADYMENVSLNITLKNAGVENSTDVNAVMSSTNPYISITDNSQTFGDILPNEFSTQNNAYAFTVANNVPDQNQASFNLNIIDGNGNSWNSAFSIKLNAPKLNTGTSIVNDTPSGNGNGKLDQGETVNIVIPVKNIGHSESQTTNCTLNSSSTFITINNPSVSLNPINKNESGNAVFSINVAANAPSGSMVEFSFNAAAGAYTTAKSFKLIIDQAMEDFESNDFSTYEWENGDTKPWTVTNDDPYEGLYCSKSGLIMDSDSSIMLLNINVAENDTIAFYRKVSAEATYDFLKFYIDNVMLDEWSGELDWSRKSYPISAGNHTLKWKFEKDYMVSEGSDCAWVDNITFPPLVNPTSIAAFSEKKMFFNVSPNPANSKITLNYDLFSESDIQIMLINALGQTMKTIEHDELGSKGMHVVNLNTSDLANGLYFIQLKNGKETLNRKVIISH